jgi:hypothetical protein
MAFAGCGSIQRLKEGGKLCNIGINSKVSFQDRRYDARRIDKNT